MITIKKYPNRRLYDTSRSTYINLDELTARIRDGHEIEVVDAKTGEDLTREVMLQVVLEVLKGSELLPTGMLRRMIRSSGEGPQHRLLRQQLVAGLELVSGQLDRMEHLWTPFQGMAGAVPPRPSRSATPEPEPEPPQERARGPRVDPEDDREADAELAALRDRLAKLESRLSRK